MRAFDLPIALGILGAAVTSAILRTPDSMMSVGELSLDGRVRPVRGALSIASAARETWHQRTCSSRRERDRGGGRQGVNVYPVRDLREPPSSLGNSNGSSAERVQPLKLDLTVPRSRNGS